MGAILYVLCLPPFALCWLCPFALLPIWFTFDRSKNFKTSFFDGWYFGLFIYVLLFYWIPDSVAKITEMNGFLSYFLCAIGFAFMGVLYGVLFVVIKFLWSRAPWLMFFVVPGFEWLCIPVFPISFGYAWRNSLCGVQIADLGGVYFLSALMCFYSYLIYLGIKNISSRMKYWSIVFVLIMLQYSYGVYRINFIKNTHELSKLTVVLLQTGIPPITKRDDPESTYKAVSAQLQKAVSDNPDNQLFILPESIFVTSFKDQADFRLKDLSSILKKDQGLLFGCNTQTGEKYYNSMGYIKGANSEFQKEEMLFSVYQKKKLMLLGEYIPLSETLSTFSDTISDYVRSNQFTSGKSDTVFSFHEFKIFPFICIESMYGNWVAETNNKVFGSDVLVNISEDGWFGTSKASILHSHASSMRAIEMRKPLIRCVNIGVSSYINEWGEENLNNEKGRLVDPIDPSSKYQFKALILKRPIFSFYAWGGHYFEVITAVLFIFAIIWFVLAIFRNKTLSKTS